MPSLPPELSTEERHAALAKAAEVRRLRAELRHELKAGNVTLGDLLNRSANDDVVGKMKTLVVLESLPGVGKVKARRTMDEIGIASSRRLRGLGEHQRASLLAVFDPQQ